MFEGIKNLFKGTYAQGVAPKKSLHALKASTALLADQNRNRIVNKFNLQLQLSEDLSAKRVAPLIKDFTEFVQLLPETQCSYYGKTGGKLDYALERTHLALELSQDYFTSAEGKLVMGKDRWLYAVLSASLLQGIGKLITELVIEIYDQRGYFIKRWQPFSSPMLAQGSYYRYRFEQSDHVNLKNRASIYLAQTLMPPAGLDWLSQDTEVMAVWLALLAEDELAAGKFGHILVRANAQALRKGYRLDFSKPGMFDSTAKSQFSALMATARMDDMLGYRFISWLEQALKDNRLVINRAPLLMVPGGILLLPEAFRMFVDLQPGPNTRSWEQVQEAFLTQQLHIASPTGGVVRTFYNPRTGEQHQGIVYAKDKLQLPGSFKMIYSPEHEPRTVSRNELFHNPALPFVIEYVLTQSQDKQAQTSIKAPAPTPGAIK